jgi:hypothetical protein
MAAEPTRRLANTNAAEYVFIAAGPPEPVEDKELF